MQTKNGYDTYTRKATLSIDAIVEQYGYLVKKIAYHLLARLPNTVDVNDLTQAGMMGLIEAYKRFESDKGASFETYAGIRIRGSIMDEIRKTDWAPRSVRRNGRAVSAAIKELEAKAGRDVSDMEVAAHMNISIEEYHDIIHSSMTTQLFSYEEMLESDDGGVLDTFSDEVSTTPYFLAEESGFQDQLANEIDQLPEREKLVLSLYYNDELNLKEIGAVLGVSESRVSQIHSQAALRLRARLSDWRD
ncbi:RNA polymerase sigma factor FliA [Marinomonas spartinae]|uniref:RNA polymerase sigma factor FliA n=1 Tax=Marinomonas spartinae TaxID=1792290 RepID=A0A1A8TIZ9_9GAMM|nr:RNA polymerase sigma factor FliA [Marinomonas spartinae]SBS26478.1 RNA polymerase sigma factor FliA [Marinomonas spartinae]SBS32773.1 RNA polymerase sigma factor FliA [Marinomonas spartinae]